MVVLRDGRKLIGILRSFDQFGMYLPFLSSSHPSKLYIFFTAANIVLENTVERIYVGNQYGEQNRGLFLVRGENVVLLGEVVCTPVHYHTIPLLITPLHVRSHSFISIILLCFSVGCHYVISHVILPFSHIYILIWCFLFDYLLYVHPRFSFILTC